MTFDFELDSVMIKVELENKKNIRHCYLRVLSPTLIQIRANVYFRKNDAINLIEEKKDWIIKNIHKSQKNALEEDEFLYLGKIEKLHNFDIIDVNKFYKKEIVKIIPPLVEKYSNIMNLHSNSIKYRKNKRTWGSCSYKNDLSFNTLLMKFPLEVIEYIVIHELSHIKHKNHSKDFWNLVRFYCPNYKQRENLLKSFL